MKRPRPPRTPSARPAAGVRTNWSGTATWTPAGHAAPRTEPEFSDLIRRTAERGGTLRPIGSGHSFTPVAATDEIQLPLKHLTGLVSVDPATHRSVFRAGTPLAVVGKALAEQGLALQNMGDIDRQTLAGAISTGTHGTGLGLTGFGGTVVCLRLMLADGSAVTVSAESDTELFHAARVGPGAFGVITEVEIQCVPADRLRCEELLGNTAYAAMCRVGRAVPALQPSLNRAAAWGMPGPAVTDDWHRVYISSRRVRFREMEYALPLESFAEAMTGVQQVLGR